MTHRQPGLHLADSNAPDFSHLPKYRKPPVVEVAIGTQFEELGFKPVHFGLLYEILKDRYQTHEYHTPLPSVVELFDTTGAPRASMSIESEFPVGRCWFLSEDGHQLVQVQPDRIVFNWRKLDAAVDYPSYETLRDSFRTELELFAGFVSDQGLEDFQPTQCELTYVNHITTEQGWRGYRDLPKVFTQWSGKTSDDYLPTVEDLKFSSSYRFDEGTTPLGRLHVQGAAAQRKDDNSPVFVMQLTARGRPIGEGINGALNFADRGHEWIVQGFTSLTTSHMHEVWERTR